MSKPQRFDEVRWRNPARPLLDREWIRAPHPFPGMLPNPDAQPVYLRRDGLQVIVDCSEKGDGRFWTHVSLSRRNRMPSYEDMTEVKQLFIGPDRRALQVFAPEREHVNIHRFCLHLWACESDDGLPDFTFGEGTI